MSRRVGTDPVTTIGESIRDAEANGVLADEAEQAGNEGRARLLSRLSGSHYASAGRAAEAVSMVTAASYYRLSQTAFLRGGSNVRAVRMGVRGAKCDTVQAATTPEDYNHACWLLATPEAA